MSMNTPYGSITAIKNIKDFSTVQGFAPANYILGVGDATLGTGIKTTLNNFMVSAMNAKGSPAITIYANDITYNKGRWVLDNGVIYESLVNNNVGHATSNENYWKRVKIGGGGEVLEIGDIATNCILEIPNRTKIELSDGILTLKAGSEMVIPNGFEADGTTKKFTYYKTTSDISQQATFNTKHYTFPQQGGTNFAHFVNQNIYVQAGKPTFSSATACWYDTSANRFKVTTNTGATWNEVNYGLPIAITTSSTTGYTSIDVEFNGFGYLKNLFWVEKGIKGLIPNGRNEDGSLNNTEFITNNTIIDTVSANYTTNFPITIKANNFTVRNPAITYDEKANYNRAVEGQPFYECLAVEALFTDGVFQWINPKTTFHALDWNDVYTRAEANNTFVAKTTPHIIDYVENGTSGRFILSNGYCEQWGTISVPAAGTTVALTKTYAIFQGGTITRMTANYKGQQTNPVLSALSGNQIAVACGGGATETAYWRVWGTLQQGQY